MALNNVSSKRISKQQGNITAFDSYNLLGFCKDKFVFESADQNSSFEVMQEQKMNTNLISKQIIIKTTSDPSGIVLINDKNIKIAVKKCSTVPQNILKIINDTQNTQTSSVTTNLGDNNRNPTITEAIKTCEKKKDNTYQNANTDKDIALKKNHVNTFSSIKVIEDSCTNQTDKVNLSKPYVYKTASHGDKTVDPYNHKIPSLDYNKKNLKGASIKQIVYDYETCLLNRGNTDFPETKDGNEDIQRSTNEKNQITKQANLKNSETVFLQEIEYENSTEGKIADNIKLKTKEIPNKEEILRKINSEMGKIKHFKEKSSTTGVVQHKLTTTNGTNKIAQAQDDDELFVQTQLASDSLYTILNGTGMNNADILSTLNRVNPQQNVHKNYTGQVRTVLFSPGMLKKANVSNSATKTHKEDMNKCELQNEKEKDAAPIEIINIEEESKCNNCNQNETITKEATKNITRQARSKKLQRAKTLNKQLFVRREIEKYMKTTMNRPKKKQKVQRKNITEEVPSSSSKTKDISCQTVCELTDSATQTEDDQETQAASSLDVKTDTTTTATTFEMILAEDNHRIVGADVNFGVGPQMQPCVVNSGVVAGGIYDAMGNNLNNIVVDNLATFPVHQSSVNYDMGYGNVYVHPHPGSNMLDEKQMFHKYFTDCSQRDSAGNLPLHIEVMNSNLEEIKRHTLMLRLRNISIDSTNLNNLTPLHLAIMHNCDENIVGYLLHRHADLSCMDSDGNNAIHLAVFYNANNLLKVLLQKANEISFNLATFNYEGFSPLLLATVEDKYDMVSTFLAYGADANVRDQKSGRTPLFHAVENNNLQMVKLLLDNGANKKIKNFSGTSTHDAVFELDGINPDIKNTIIGKDVFAVNRRVDKRKTVAQQKPIKENFCVKKLKTVKTYRKIKILTRE